ncbi:MAG: GNAT family N-acetyltransferase [Chloroflexi bacterium]|nr:GNAT family N-acetyltransferase [Chloroflexota bacterium]
MSNSKQLANDFLQALMSTETSCYESILDEDSSLIFQRWDGMEAHRPRQRVVQRLIEERQTWSDPKIEAFSTTAEGDQIAAEFRIQATECDRYVEHNRSAFLKIQGDKIKQIILYCPEPMPSARRKGWIAPATLTKDELENVLESVFRGGDIREWVEPNASGRMSLRGGMGGSGDAHPGSNSVGFVRWSPEEADQKIEEIIAFHSLRDIGFQWFVSPHDTPVDLKERLERHGLVLAGDAATMARLGLDDLDIPTNPDITIDVMDGSDQVAIDATAHITQVCFNLTDEQIADMKISMVERMRDERFRDREINFLASLKGQPVGIARLQLRCGIAYLGGAATLPEFRGQKIYSTLLRKRLEVAFSHGYQVAAINAEPMSRRVVSRYGFKEYARMYIYGWMPVMDVDVIKSLVPQ